MTAPANCDLTHPGQQLARLFRPSFLARVLAEDQCKALHALGLGSLGSADRTVESMLSDVYELLLRDYRCEYVYKNELARQFSSRSHSQTLISELNVGWCSGRVDFLVVDETTTSFEIKTELDSFQRVRQQTDTNLRLFDRNFVVCSTEGVESLFRVLDDRVGILCMGSSGTFELVRKPRANHTRIDADAVFQCLRRSEYTRVVRNVFGEVPRLTNIELEHFCRDAFQQIAPALCHSSLVSILRDRYLSTNLPDQGIPSALTHLYFATKPDLRSKIFGSNLLKQPSG